MKVRKTGVAYYYVEKDVFLLLHFKRQVKAATDCLLFTALLRLKLLFNPAIHAAGHVFSYLGGF